MKERKIRNIIKKGKKILVFANSASGLYDFRNELLVRLLGDGFEVHVSLPDGDTVPELAKEGCKIYHTPLDRRGMNPAKDMGLMAAYDRLIKAIKPDVALTYTIKPNIYASLCCRLHRIPYIVNITGLGSVFENGGPVQKLVVFLYRRALRKASCIFFQNERNREVFDRMRIHGKRTRLVPGSGVSLDRHHFEEYPSREEPVKFLYVGRIMKEKGMDELFYAAKEIKKEVPGVVFELVGYHEDDYRELTARYEQEGIIRITGFQSDMHPFYRSAWAVLMPSYHEGMSNVILEAAATGRPVLASDIPGCREGFDEGATGFGFPPRDREALYAAMKKFLALPYGKKVQMGHDARKKMEREFDRQQVVDAYVEEIGAAMNEYMEY